jgi:peptide/nickel transport system permease protein
LTAAAETAPTRDTRRLAAEPAVVIPLAILLLIALMAIAAPLLDTVDPTQINPAMRNKMPGAVETLWLDGGMTHRFTHWMGTDSLGRDIYSRVLYGGRVSLVVGALVAFLSITVGTAIGLVAGYLRWLDAIVMRIMDGLMAIPPILLALGVVSLYRAGLPAVIIAIAVPEIPRVVRLVRSIVLSIREEPYVEAAITAGTRLVPLLWRHVLPNCIAPLIVQATFVCASAIVVESILSFLGVGIPAETPSWGNVMAEGRQYFRLFPGQILFPGLFLAITVLCVNLLGDALRDRLDPKLRQRV